MKPELEDTWEEFLEDISECEAVKIKFGKGKYQLIFPEEDSDGLRFESGINKITFNDRMLDLIDEIAFLTNEGCWIIIFSMPYPTIKLQTLHYKS